MVFLLKNGWNEQEIPGAIVELKRYLMLKVLAHDYSAHYLSPSLCIDELWHLKLQFNVEYTDMCLELSKPILLDDGKKICSNLIGHNP